MVIQFPQRDTNPTKPRAKTRHKANIITFPKPQPSTLIFIASDNRTLRHGILQGDELTVALSVTPRLGDLVIYENEAGYFIRPYHASISGKVLGKVVRVTRNL